LAVSSALPAWHVSQKGVAAGGLRGAADDVGSHQVAAADRCLGEEQLRSPWCQVTERR
jgi:hypothetical protein